MYVCSLLLVSKNSSFSFWYVDRVCNVQSVSLERRISFANTILVACMFRSNFVVGEVLAVSGVFEDTPFLVDNTVQGPFFMLDMSQSLERCTQSATNTRVLVRARS